MRLPYGNLLTRYSLEKKDFGATTQKLRQLLCQSFKIGYEKRKKRISSQGRFR